MAEEIVEEDDIPRPERRHQPGFDVKGAHVCVHRAAVLDVAKRANLRLNLHALTLTVVIVSLYQPGALAALLGPLGR